jgi:hypothetical protein
VPSKIVPTNSNASSSGHRSMINVFDATAHDAVHKLLLDKGIQVGTILQPKSNNAYMLETQLKVSHISDDASIGVQSINIDGGSDGTTVIVSGDCLAEYFIIKPENRIKESPQIYPVLKELDMVHRMVADLALYRAFEKHTVSPTKVMMQSAPRKRLIARNDIGVGEITLVPWTHGVQQRPVVSPGELVCVEVMTTPPKLFAISTPTGLGKNLLTEFWRMSEEKKEPKHANMKSSYVEEIVNWPINIGLGKSVSVRVPVAINSKVVKKNYELRLLASTIDSKKRKALELSLLDYGR